MSNYLHIFKNMFAAIISYLIRTIGIGIDFKATC